MACPTVTSTVIDATPAIEDIVAEIGFIDEEEHREEVFDYMLPPLPTMDTSLDIDFSAFATDSNTELVTELVSPIVKIRNTKQLVIPMPRKRMNLSPFRGLAIRSNPSHKGRASKPPNSVVIMDIEVAIVKVPDIEYYGREQVLSPYLVDDSSTTSNEEGMKASDACGMKPVVEHIMDATKNIFSKAITKSIAEPLMEVIMKHTMKTTKHAIIKPLDETFTNAITKVITLH